MPPQPRQPSSRARQPSPRDPPAPVSLSNVALILAQLGPDAEALPLIQPAVAISEAAYGPGHPGVATYRAALSAISHAARPG